jgi:DNA-binding transcriptional regulator YiaG
LTLTTPQRRQMREETRLSGRPWRNLTPERIRAARQYLRMNQADFAVLVGREERRGISVDWTKISRWERGVRKPGALWGPALLRICERTERERANAEKRVGEGQAAG